MNIAIIIVHVRSQICNIILELHTVTIPHTGKLTKVLNQDLA